MNFRLEFTPKPFTNTINLQDSLMLVGSCFTENMGTKLKQLKFDVLENPNGILFNPASIVKSLRSYIEAKQYTPDDLFYHNESWHSWEHHSRFSHPDAEACATGINQSQQLAHAFLQKADWLMITVGSAFVYALTSAVSTKDAAGLLVANCHKVPTDKFNKILLPTDEIVASFQEVLNQLFRYNEKIRVIFTISPVRHLRDGFVENNRSKARLIEAIHRLVDADSRLQYFPAYELIIDDLRDYRFFAEDMVHPNYAATNYVWEKFISTCIDEPSRLLMKDIHQLNAARSHKPFNPQSQQHRRFMQQNLDKATAMQQQYPWLNLSEEINYFASM